MNPRDAAWLQYVITHPGPQNEASFKAGWEAGVIALTAELKRWKA